MVDKFSIQIYRVTMTDLRLCLTCLSHSQANFFHYNYLTNNQKLFIINLLLYTSDTFLEAAAPAKLPFKYFLKFIKIKYSTIIFNKMVFQ